MKAYLLLLSLFLSVTSLAQTDSAWLKKNIKSGMDSLAFSFEKQDWKTFTGFMHPSLVEMVGGEESFVKLIETQMSSMAEAKITVMKSGNILQLLQHNNQWQCVIESYLQMTIDSTLLSTVSSNVGISFDNGLSWKFIRVTNGNETKVKELFADISPAIKIPYNKTSIGITIDELLKTYQPKYPSVQ